MTIINRGTIEATETVALAMNVGTFVNEGLVHVIGTGGITGGTGTFTNACTILVDASRKFTRTAGLLQSAGATTVHGELELSGTNVLEIAGGVLNGTGLVDCDVLISGGAVEPGASVGQLAVEGKYTQANGGRLVAELGGTGTGGVEYDLITVTGVAALGGQLRLEAVNGYVPQMGDTFTVLTAGSVSGRFSSVVPCGTYKVSYTPTSVVVEVVGGPPVFGDVSCDGDADMQDLGFFCSQLGLTEDDPAFNPQADLNDDGVIDDLDRAILIGITGACNGDMVSSGTFQPPPDGVVDGADLAYLLGAWGAGPSCADQVSNATFAPPPDGVVDAADLAFMLGNWGPCD